MQELEIKSNPNFTNARIKAIYTILENYAHLTYVFPKVNFLYGGEFEDFYQEILSNLMSRNGYKNNVFTENIETMKKSTLIGSRFANFIRQVAYNHLKIKQRDYRTKMNYLGQNQLISLDSEVYEERAEIVDMVTDNLQEESVKYKEALNCVISNVNNLKNQKLKTAMLQYIVALTNDLRDPHGAIETVARQLALSKSESKKVRDTLKTLVINSNCMVVPSQQEILMEKRRFLVSKATESFCVQYEDQLLVIEPHTAIYIDNTDNLKGELPKGVSLRRKVRAQGIMHHVSKPEEKIIQLDK